MGEDNPELGDNSQEIAILHVNPTTKATELFIRTPKNYHVGRHWHTSNETITVLRGTFIANSNEGGHPFQSDPGHHSNLMAASLASSHGPILVMS
jgi:hypothetical protein